jgi:hypothetical protein
MLFIITFKDYQGQYEYARYEYSSCPPALLTSQRVLLKTQKYPNVEQLFEVGGMKPIEFYDDTIKITYLGAVI